MIGPIYIIAGAAGIVIAVVFLIRKLNARSRKDQQKRVTEEQRTAVRYALEMFQPFHWEALHFAILSEEFRRSGGEKHDSHKVELIKGYLKAFDSLQEEVKNLDGKLNSNEINKIVTVNLRDEINKIVKTLSEACRLAQEEKDLAECFQLIENAYRDSAQIEKSLRSLFRRSSD
jgi:hypothetical protein